MLLAIALIASLADWVPMRWTSDDPGSLELLEGTPVNCVLLERGQWTSPLIEAAASRGIATLGVVHPSADSLEMARSAMNLKVNGVVLEGDFPAAEAQRIRSMLADSQVVTVELPPRSKMRFDNGSAIAGTFQGVWPGIQVDDGGSTKAAPSGGPWINTNSGFLRFVRAPTSAMVWIGYSPPPKTVITADRYMQAVSDASMVGARWIITLDEDYSKRFFARDASALKDWKAIAAQIGFFENHKEWRKWKPLSELAIVQDADSGALYSGGVLDMIAVKHTPVRTVPSRKLDLAAMQGAKMAVDVDPSSLTSEQKTVLRAFARGGGTLLSGPAGWSFPQPTADRITLGDDEVKKLDEIWKEVNSMTGRRNLGARLFNVSSMLSNLLESPEGKRTVLSLVNYSGYPVENVTVHLLGKYKSARLLAPGAAERKLDVYEVEEGTGVDIEKVGVTAALVLE